ncbi:MAG TPA: hypothetical protein PK059_08255 [Cyclobacteriaceae bacterium]|jgi:hypothetical protein|nr:hypothetical protein [Cyclobacteriaceae bacterium]
MTPTEAHIKLDTLRRRYLLLRWTETILMAGAITLLTSSLAKGEITTVWLAGLCAVFAVSVLIIARHLKLFTISNRDLTAYLNQQYPDFKDSADLLTQPAKNLTTLQQIQQLQSVATLDLIYPQVKLPHRIPVAALLLSLAGILFFAVTLIPDSQQMPSASTDSTDDSPSTTRDTIPAKVLATNLSVAPPTYTQLASFNAQALHVEFPEGSTMHWKVVFSKPIQQAAIIWDGRDTTSLKETAQGFETRRERTGSGFYQLQWKDDLGAHTSDFYELKALADQAPKITIDNLSQFTQLSVDDAKIIQLKATLADDYGLAQSDVIATVSKGSGESVKFREERLMFSSPAAIRGKLVHATLTFDLTKMGLEPGDELYFYVQSLDNKPRPNYSRTETFFIALKDTAQQAVTADAGLGVDLMPEYFRSQRQIIIDTEKLLRDRKTISRQTFNSTSNELGYDQKVLRLRYGQFLGEEAEAGIGVETGEHADEEEEDPVKKFGHTHDTNNEHNLVAKQQEREHEHANTDPNAKEDPMKAFMHTHDNEEEATFFIQSVKAKLKAALTLMWDAELQLRLYEPAKSLPYQYKILNLLKEISNDSRIYVHRTGFDPPPLKEDRRLTGDLAEIRNSVNPYLLQDQKSLPAIAEALHTTERLMELERVTLTITDQQVFRKAGIEVATIALQQPGKHLTLMSMLKNLSDADAATQQELLSVRKGLWLILPPPTDTPGARTTQSHELNQKLLNALNRHRE